MVLTVNVVLLATGASGSQSSSHTEVHYFIHKMIYASQHDQLYRDRGPSSNGRSDIMKLEIAAYQAVRGTTDDKCYVSVSRRS